MYRLFVALALAAAASVLHASPAQAAAAPWCETGDSRFFCTTENGVAAASWTIYRAWGNSTVTVPGASSYLHDNCQGHTLVRVHYNYYSGGTLVASPATQFVCNPYDWP